jgi:ABC-2 type transport system permease protein
MSAFAKYRHSFLIGLQSNLVYRWNFALRAIFSLFHLAVVFILWGAAYQGKTSIGGFDLAQTMTYFVAVLLMQFFISASNEDYQISEDIRNGLINQFLLKPINYFGYRFSIFVAARLVAGGLALIPVLIALPLLLGHLHFPTEAWRIGYAIPALAMSAIIQFSIAYCFGLLTFWFLEIQSFIVLSLAIETLLAGQVFPLDLMPKWLFDLSQYLPYYYQMYFPVSIITGRATDISAILLHLAIQAFWVLALLAVGETLWRRGLRRHTAVGG